ncbi:CoA ester lyase [Lentisphaerota bacterium ZTH]|nr:CoA ester lyase [Lentisphaerota bacterium]WET05138.1 CoA ester lyase [Lentisphaerota bacterium ZTH]
MFYRSYLFTPGNRPERFTNGAACGADAVVLDWEDGVGPAHKDEARRQVIDFYLNESNFKDCGTAFGIRLNSLESDYIVDDLRALRETSIQPAFIFLAKVECGRDVEILARLLGDNYSDIPLIPTLESIRALDNAEEVAACARSTALGLSHGDLSSIYNIEPGNWDGLLHACYMTLKAARKFNIPAVDGPWLDVRDLDGLKKEITSGLKLGFDAKVAIHPSQVAAINKGFSPTENQIEFARKAIARYEDNDHNACMLNGVMLDEAVIIRLRNLLKSIEK